MGMYPEFPVIDLRATGQKITSMRNASGLTVRDLQNYFGFEYPQAIYNWQTGKTLPSIDNLVALAKLLHVRMEDLLVIEDREVSAFLKAGTICAMGLEFGRICDRIQPDLI